MPTDSDLLNDHTLTLVQQAGAKALTGGHGGFEVSGPDLSAKLNKEFQRLIPHQHQRVLIQEPAPAPPQLDKLELDSGSITFSGGVPVGGHSHLSIFPNGSYSFTGHFHDSGATSYDMAIVWLLKSSKGTVFTFAHSCRVHGTFESGSRDGDWGESGTNGALAAAWADISLGYQWSWSATANFDLGALIDQAVKALGQVAAVVAIVA